MTPEEVLNRINQLMADKDMTISDLCEKADIPQSTFYSMVDRGTYPAMDNMVKICDGLGVTYLQFFSGIASLHNSDPDPYYPTSGELYLLETYNCINRDFKNRLIGYAESAREATKNNVKLDL